MVRVCSPRDLVAFLILSLISDYHWEVNYLMSPAFSAFSSVNSG